MKTENKMLMLDAREALKGKWGIAISGVLTYQVINIFVSVIFGFLITAVLGQSLGGKIPNLVSWVIYGPLMTGVAYFFLKISRGKDVIIGDIFTGFRNFSRNTVAGVILSVSMYLGYMLFIIPGIILTLIFSQVLFILAEDDTVSAIDAIKKSVKMMEGNKRKLLGLLSKFLAFILLPLLLLFVVINFVGFSNLAKGLGYESLLTLASGSVLAAIAALFVFISVFVFMIWLTPYAFTTLAKFYDDIKSDIKEMKIEEVAPSVSEEKVN